MWGILETDGDLSIDTLGEYYYANDTVYVYSESDPSSAFASVEIPQVESLIEFQCSSDSSEYIVVDGLELAYSKFYNLRTDFPGGITGQTRQIRGFEARNNHIHHVGYKNSSQARYIGLFASDVKSTKNEFVG